MTERRHHLIVVMAMLLIATGCAGYRQVVLPDRGGPSGGTGAACMDITPGSYVRVRMASGETVSGELREMSVGTIVLERPRNYSFKERTIAVEEIEKLEVIEEPLRGGVRFSTAGVFLTSMFAALILLVTQIRIEAN